MLTRLLIAWIVYALIVGFALGGSFVAGFLEPPHTNIHQQAPQSEQQATEQHSKEKADEALARYTLWLTGFTAVLALATIGLGIATVGLYLTGEKQIGIATRAAAHTEDAFRRLERPYLLVKIIDTVHLRYPQGGRPRMDYRLVNYGKLPAILRSVAVGLQFKPPQPLRTPMAIRDRRYEVIAPGGESLNPLTAVVVDSNNDDSFQGQNATLLILHGLIQYEDPTGALHTDSFCMRALPGASSFTIDGGEEYNWTETEYPPPRPHHVRGEPRE